MVDEPVRRGRRPFAVLGAVALLTGLAVAASGSPVLRAWNAGGSVTSIEARPEFHDPARLAQAWASPVAASYRRFSYEYQSNPSFCGPASVANLLHSLGLEAAQADMLRGTAFRPWFGVLVNGLTLDELADVVRTRLDRPVHVVRDLSLPAFREAMKRSNDPDRRMIVNFHRGPLFGRGAGHFSPILGYLADEDLVFVGDVNDHYRPFLVGSERLWRAVTTIDGASGKGRGLLIVETTPRRGNPG